MDGTIGALARLFEGPMRRARCRKVLERGRLRMLHVRLTKPLVLPARVMVYTS